VQVSSVIVFESRVPAEFQLRLVTACRWLATAVLGASLDIGQP